MSSDELKKSEIAVQKTISAFEVNTNGLVNLSSGQKVPNDIADDLLMAEKKGKLAFYFSDPLKVLDTLVGIFGDCRSPSVLLQEFLSTKQCTGEPARRYSYRVKTAFDALVNRQRFLSVDVTPATLLTDHFVENLCSGMMCSFIREKMCQSTMKFSDVRQIAVRWESAEELVVNQIQAPASIPQPSLDTTPLPHSPVVPTPCPSTDLMAALLCYPLSPVPWLLSTSNGLPLTL